MDLVGDYRDRAERRGIREENTRRYEEGVDRNEDRYQEGLTYRGEQDTENKRRYENQNDRANSMEQRQIVARNQQTITFKDQQAKKKAQAIARSNNTEGQQMATNEAEQAALDANDQNLARAQEGVTTAEKAESAMAYGNSGKGQTIEVEENSDNTLSPMGVDGEGNKRPLTVVPGDPNSPKMKVEKAEMDKLREHVQNGYVSYTDMFGEDADPQNRSAFLRGTIHSDKKTGMSRVASPEELEANLKEQKLVKRREDFSMAEDYSAPGAGGDKQMLKDGAKVGARIIGKTAEKYLPLLAGVKAIDEYFSGEGWNGKKAVKVDKDGAVKVNAKFNMTTDAEQLIQGVKNAKKAGVELKASKANLKLAEKSHSEQMATIKKEFKSKRMKDSRATEMYTTELWSEEEYNNYRDTGDMRYSSKEQADYGLNREKDKLAYSQQKLEFKTAIYEYNQLGEEDTEGRAKQMKAFRAASNELARRGLSASGLYDSKNDPALTQAVDSFSEANDLAMAHMGYDPAFINDYDVAGLVSKQAAMYHRMNKGDFGFKTTLPAMSAIQKGFAPNNIKEFSEAFAALASKTSEDRAYSMIKDSTRKGDELLEHIYILTNKR